MGSVIGIETWVSSRNGRVVKTPLGCSRSTSHTLESTAKCCRSVDASSQSAAKKGFERGLNHRAGPSPWRASAARPQLGLAELDQTVVMAPAVGADGVAAALRQLVDDDGAALEELSDDKKGCSESQTLETLSQTWSRSETLG